jgi:hypothetical protein
MEKIITIKNRSAAQVTYLIPEDGIRRSFAPGEAKRISSEELEKLTYQPGGKEILIGFLQVVEEEGRQLAGLHVEPEYNMSEADVIKLIKEGSIDEFLDCLDFAPVGVIDLIKKFSISIPLYDMQKRAALKKKTGFDVDAALKNIAAEKEDEDGTILKQAAPERRVKKDEVPAGRRTTPKYNVVTPKVEEATAE